MKKIISLALAALTIASVLASCAPAQDRLDEAITLASSDAVEYALWLDDRLDNFPTDVVVGIGSNETYGIDMSDFEDDGYILRSFGKDTLVFGASADGLDRAVRAYAKAADAGSASLLDETYHEGARIKKLTVAGRDIAEFTVVYNYDRDVKNSDRQAPTLGNAKYAAEELVRLITQATGITLTAVPHTEKVSGAIINIDYYTGDDLGENGFTYEVENGNVYINGVGTANGCANAVYYLLEHECGWDALLFGDSDLQSADHIDIPEGLTKKVKPMFDWWWMRDMYFDDYDSDKSDFSHTYRGSVPKASHSITQWTSSGDYWAQPCLSARGQAMDTADRIWAYVNAQESAGKVVGEDLIAIDLGMTDNANFCQCKECRNAYVEENRTFSGSIIRFANEIADELEAELPELKYTVYAYHGTNVPCKTPPHANVYVTYCTDGACANHLLDGSECGDGGCGDFLQSVLSGIDAKNEENAEITNKDFTNWMRGWGELTDNVYVYHYVLHGNFAEYTYLRTLYEDLHLIADAGMAGFQPEAEYVGLGLGRLRFRLMMDIIWHPEMTKEEYEARIADHIRREYGDGYDEVSEYIDLWYLTERNMGCWSSWLYAVLIYPTYYDKDLYASLAPKMYELLLEAMNKANTADQERHLRQLACDVLYKECSIKYFPAYDAGDTETIDYLSERYDIFVSYMKMSGYSFEIPPDNIYCFGPGAYATAKKVLQANLTDAAWIDWQPWRNALTAQGAVQRPVPDGYEAYVPEG